jgi:hypothetical protein
MSIHDEQKKVATGVTDGSAANKSMTQEDIVETARKSGLPTKQVGWIECYLFFAKLVAAKERERIIAKNKPEIEKCNAYIKELEEALAKQEQGEPVAVKHMMRWVESLKRQSDYAQYMRIPGLNAGACFELAIELEQFINTTPQQRTWVDLTDEEMNEIWADQNKTGESITRAIEAKLKQKNGYNIKEKNNTP